MRRTPVRRSRLSLLTSSCFLSLVFDNMILDGIHITWEVGAFLRMYDQQVCGYNICNKIKHQGGVSALPFNLRRRYIDSQVALDFVAGYDS